MFKWLENILDREPEAYEPGPECMTRYEEGKEGQNSINITKIVVPTARDKVQLLLAIKYIHDSRCIDTDYMAVNTLVHQFNFPDNIEVEAPVCPVPPYGWLCTRTPGHGGPCAAWPMFPVPTPPPTRKVNSGLL